MSDYIDSTSGALRATARAGSEALLGAILGAGIGGSLRTPSRAAGAVVGIILGDTHGRWASLDNTIRNNRKLLGLSTDRGVSLMESSGGGYALAGLALGGISSGAKGASIGNLIGSGIDAKNVLQKKEREIMRDRFAHHRGNN